MSQVGDNAEEGREDHELTTSSNRHNSSLLNCSNKPQTDGSKEISPNRSSDLPEPWDLCVPKHTEFWSRYHIPNNSTWTTTVGLLTLSFPADTSVSQFSKVIVPCAWCDCQPYLCHFNYYGKVHTPVQPATAHTHLTRHMICQSDIVTHCCHCEEFSSTTQRYA